MITTDTNSSTTAFHTTNNNNKLSVFSYHKAQAMISESTQSKITPQQFLSDRFISICSRAQSIINRLPHNSLGMCLILASIPTFIYAQVYGMVEHGLINNITANNITANNVVATNIVTNIVTNITAANLEVNFDLSMEYLAGCCTSIPLLLLGLYLLRAPRITRQPLIHYSLQNINRLASALNTSDEDNPDISTLFQLTKEIQDLSFLSGGSRYDTVRKSLIHYLNTHQQCFDPLLQHAIEQDQKKLHGMLEDLDRDECLSLTQIEKYYECLEESTKTPEGAPDTKLLKVALVRKLLSDLPSLNEEIINSSDARRRLTRLKNNVITETIKQPNQTRTEEGELQETQCNIDDLIDKLHYTSRLCSLLNSCYPSLDSTLRPTQNQCTQLTQCDKIYQNLRKKLLALCLSPYEETPKVWAMSAIARQLNRTWIERYINQPLPHEHPENPVKPDNQCPISHQSFDELAPTVDQADNIAILDADNHLYSKAAIMDWAKTTNIPLGVLSPLSHRLAHILDVIPLTKIINMEQFTIANLLPETLPLDFIPQQEETI